MTPAARFAPAAPLPRLGRQDAMEQEQGPGLGAALRWFKLAHYGRGSAVVAAVVRSRAREKEGVGGLTGVRGAERGEGRGGGRGAGHCRCVPALLPPPALPLWQSALGLRCLCPGTCAAVCADALPVQKGRRGGGAAERIAERCGMA